MKSSSKAPFISYATIAYLGHVGQSGMMTNIMAEGGVIRAQSCATALSQEYGICQAHHSFIRHIIYVSYE
ncbi:MAG: hypothetical protein OIF58_04665 [Cohaesibacter sp.]|nr:hypothetical protein [Cohaesibacter sp.]